MFVAVGHGMDKVAVANLLDGLKGDSLIGILSLQSCTEV